MEIKPHQTPYNLSGFDMPDQTCNKYLQLIQVPALEHVPGWNTWIIF